MVGCIQPFGAGLPVHRAERDCAVVEGWMKLMPYEVVVASLLSGVIGYWLGGAVESFAVAAVLSLFQGSVLGIISCALYLRRVGGIY